MVVETVFENRFLHVGELMRMGASIRIDGRTAVIQGVDRLMGTKVDAYDLRGGAALVLAALSAEGETQIDGAEHISRGYECKSGARIVNFAHHNDGKIQALCRCFAYYERICSINLLN